MEIHKYSTLYMVLKTWVQESFKLMAPVVYAKGQIYPKNKAESMLK